MKTRMKTGMKTMVKTIMKTRRIARHSASKSLKGASNRSALPHPRGAEAHRGEQVSDLIRTTTPE